MIRKRFRNCLLLLAALFPWSQGIGAESGTNAIPETSMIERGLLAEVKELLARDETEAAERKLRDISADHPGFLESRRLHAAVLILLNRYPEAIDLQEDLLQAHPGDVQTLNNLSWLFSTASDQRYRNPARALQLAQEAVLLAPGDYHVWSTLAEAHFVNHRYEPAVKAMQQALDLAVKHQADPVRLASYQRQMAVLREASDTMSLME